MGYFVLYLLGIILSINKKIRLVFMKNLKALRENKGLSQLQLALKLGLNQNTISRYENGQREADYQTLIMFADFFDVSIDYLIGRTDN